MAAEEWWRPSAFQVIDAKSNVLLTKVREQLLANNNDQLRAQYSKAKNKFRNSMSGRVRKLGHSVVEIPLVVRPKENASLDDADILVIGDVVTWPEGTAAKILHGELRVCTAKFEGEKRSKDKKKEKRFRKHTKMQISIQQSDAQGKRPSMEDRYIIHLFKDIAVFGVFDGHGGTTAADLASQAFIPALRSEFQRLQQQQGMRIAFTESNPQPPDAIENETLKSMIDSLRRTVQDVEDETVVYLTEHKDSSGTTLCVCLCTRNTLIVANMGDSRVVVSRKGVARLATKADHVARDKSETRRITDAGGFVNDEGYLGGLVQVSRAIGDLDPMTNKKIIGLSAEPDIIEFPLDREKDEFILVACDGLWDVISAQGAVQEVRTSLKSSNGDLVKATDELVAKALALNTTDNVTVVIAFLPSVGRVWTNYPPASSPSTPEPTDQRRPKFTKIQDLL